MRKKWMFLLALIAALVPVAVIGAEGDLDTSFNGTGLAFYNSEFDPGAYGEDHGNAVAIQPDGKIVVVGHRAFDFNEDVLVLRYKTDGTLDGAFGTAGVVTYHCGIDYGGDRGHGVAIQPDGKIVVVGYTRDGTNRDVLVLRYDSTGALDGSFGTGGVFTFDGSGHGIDEANGVAIQSDGKIVVVGYTHNGTDPDVLVLRLDKNGALDSTFGTGGVATYDRYVYDDDVNGFHFNEASLVGQAVAIQGWDGSIFVLGSGGPLVFVMKYDSGGSLLTYFGGLSGVTKPYVGVADPPGGGTGAGARGLALQSDGRILVGGDKGVAGSDVVVLRYKTNGELDETFGTAGEATYEGSIGGYDFGYDVAVQSDGKILLSGTQADVDHGGVAEYDLLVLRFDSTGNLDGTFGTGGVVKVNGLSNYSRDDGRAIALHPAGKIIVVGTTADWDLGADNRTWDVFVASLVGPAQPDIDVLPPQPIFDFGTVAIGGTKDQAFTIYNTGGGDLTVTYVGTWGGDVFDFQLLSTCAGSTIGPGAQCVFSVQFSPFSAGLRSTTLTISSTDPDESPWTITLQGTGGTVSPADIDVTPSPVPFGTITVGESADQEVTILNTGGSNLVVPFTYITGDDISMFSIATGGSNACATLTPTIPAGGSCTLLATFTPASAGLKTAILRINSNDPDENPKDVTLTGTGAAGPTPQDIDVTPSPVSFGSVSVGGSIQRQVTVSNTGGSDLEVTNISVTGADAVMFNVASGGTNPCGDVTFKIIPGGSCTLIATFTPGSAGAKTATLRITSDDPDENPKDVTLNGTGVVSDHGKLDTSFNGKGYALYNSEFDPGAYGEDYGNAVAIQPDGKIVVVGYRAFDFNEDVLILRYKIDGTLDGAFGTAGVVTYHCGIAYGGDRGHGVAIQPDGKIVVVGYTRDGTNRDVLVLRYDSTGALDSTFGTGGVFTFDGPGRGIDEANGVAIQSDGKIVVVGYTDNGTDTDVLLMRLDKNGALDTTFGTGGVATYDRYVYHDVVNGFHFDEANLVGQAVAVQGTDGSIFVLGNGGAVVFVMKYDNTGSLAATFGMGGVTKPYVGAADPPGGGIGAGARGLALEPDGKIIVGGDKGVAGSDVVVLRYKTDGTLDPTFGTGGEATYEGSIGGHDFGYGVAVQSDGKILLSGTQADVDHGGVAEYDLLVLRFDSNGNLDGTFGTGGVVKVNGPSNYSRDDGRAIALHPAGKIIVAGTTANWDLGAENRTWDVFVVSLVGPAQPDIDVNPPSHNFGSVNVGSSANRQFRISNTGGAALNVTGIVMTGGDAGMFSVASGGTNPCGSLAPTIAAGGSCTVMATFTPTSAGAKPTTMRISSNDPDENPKDIALSGTGVVVAQPDIDVNPTSHNFGSVNVGSSASQQFTISNTGGAALNVTGIVMTGGDAGMFSVASGGTNPCGSLAPTIAAGGSCTVVATFSPASKGAKSTTMRINSDDPDENPKDIPLSGKGVSFKVTPNEGTYGTEVLIEDSEFGSKKGKVLIGSVALKVQEWKASTIKGTLSKAMTPETYNVTIQRKDPKGAPPLTEEDAFTVKPPEIDEILPAPEGTAGEQITITGKFFGTKKGKVYIGTKSCKIVSWTMITTSGASEIKFVVPKNLPLGKQELKVVNVVGEDTTSFTVK